MGVVQRQGIKQSIVTWFGMALGAVNVFFIFPAALSTEQLGIIGFVRDSAIFLSPFLFWGGGELIVRFFPRFKNEANGHNGYLFLQQVIFALGVAALVPLFLIFRQPFLDVFGKNEPLYQAYVPFILPFAMLITYAAMFSYHALNFKRAAVPALFNELTPKLGLMILALAFWLGGMSFSGIFWGQLVAYAFIVLAQIWYLHSLGELHLRPNFGFLKKPLLKEMAGFGMFGLVGNLGTRLTDRVNGILLPLLSSLSDGGIYMVGYFISEAMDAPRKAISRIVSPLISEKWSLGKLAEIEDLYKKSALNQLIVGLALLLAVWVSVDDLFRIMPNGDAFSRGKYVILLLGVARLVDMATGVNTEILSFTSHYRYNFYLTIFLGVFNLAANLLLIPILQLNGAALAALLSVATYNLLKFLVLRWKMKMQPFTGKMFLALAAAVGAWLAVAWLPEFGSPFLGVLVKSAVAVGIFGGVVLGLKISPEVNELTKKALSKIRR